MTPEFLRDVPHYQSPKGYKKPMALYRCECGTEFVANPYKVRIKHTNSCGCYQKKRASECSWIHGQMRVRGKHPTEYNSWQAMKQRCTNPKTISYKYYGGRGIKVCDRWFNSFPNFYADLGPKPGRNYTVDRINNDGNYEPSNCRWASRRQQWENSRSGKEFLGRGTK